MFTVYSYAIHSVFDLNILNVFFVTGEELGQRLSDSHSDSTDSGIQSVGGEETGTYTSLVHRVLGGECQITYQCAQCDTSSRNTDKFRDLQLCFPEEIQENQEVSVQDLINYYLTPEKLTGENKYRCDKCTKLCDAQRIITILQAPAHLILTLKHFRYDFDTRLRTKLRHKVVYNDTIQLPVSAIPYTVPETYHLYAAVVHSGYSMDYGHYFTYACDSKQNWYKFNDSFVTQTTFEDFKSLKPPDTPYILFYEKSGAHDGLYEDDKPELSTLSKRIQELIANDTTEYIEELRRRAIASQRSQLPTKPLRQHNNSDDDNPPPSSCRGAIDVPANRFLY